MRSVFFRKIGAGVGQSVRLPRRLAIGPEIRAPKQNGQVFHLRLARDLIRYQPTHCKSFFISVGLWIERCRRVTTVNSAGEIDDFQIRKLRFQIDQILHQVCLKLFDVIGKFAVLRGTSLRLLHPGHLNLLIAQTRRLYSSIYGFPEWSLRVRPPQRRLAALCPVDDHHFRRFFGVRISELFKFGILHRGIRHAH